MSSTPGDGDGRAGATPAVGGDVPATGAERRWLAVLLSCAAFVSLFVVQSLAVMLMLVVDTRTNQGTDVDEWLDQAVSNGRIFSACVIATSVVIVPLVFALASMVGPESAASYLGLRRPRRGKLLAWTAITLVYVAAADSLTWFTGRDIVPTFMQDVYRTADPLLALWLAVVVAAPLSEEIVFRGMLLRALGDTPLRFLGAALITSLLWAAIHIQYDDPYIVAIIFVGGLILAFAKRSSSSLIPCIAMHGAWNLVATLETAVVVSNMYRH